MNCSRVITTIEMSEIEILRGELAALRAELAKLKSALTNGTLELRCASLHVGTDERYGVQISVQDDGPALHFTDAQAPESGHLAALVATPEGATLAINGRDGVPRAVLTARPEGGGLSLIDGEATLGADLWGSSEASWLLLHHGGQPAVLALGTGAGGNVEVYDEDSSLQTALPELEAEVFVPPGDESSED